MRTLVTLLTIVLLLLVALAGNAQPGMATSQPNVSFWQAAAESVANPWATVPLLLVGMMLITTEIMRTSAWRSVGMVGTLCLGSVVTSHVAIGAASSASLLILVVGLGFILMETHVIPGRGTSVLMGLGGIFLGMFLMLGTRSSGLAYPLIVSAMVTFLSAIAFLVHLPNNTTWRILSRRAHVTEGCWVEEPLSVCDTPSVKASIRHTQVTPTEESQQQTLGHRDEE